MFKHIIYSSANCKKKAAPNFNKKNPIKPIELVDIFKGHDGTVKRKEMLG